MAVQDDYVRRSVRLPPGLYERIANSAAQCERSVNDEFISRLAGSFDAEQINARLDRVEGLLHQLLKGRK